MRKYRLLCTIAAFHGTLLAFQQPVRITDRKPIEPLGIARSAILDLRAGETVTTGTLTEAMPIAAGETWSTELSGIEVRGLQLRLR